MTVGRSGLNCFIAQSTSNSTLQLVVSIFRLSHLKGIDDLRPQKSDSIQRFGKRLGVQMGIAVLRGDRRWLAT